MALPCQQPATDLTIFAKSMQSQAALRMEDFVQCHGVGEFLNDQWFQNHCGGLGGKQYPRKPNTKGWIRLRTSGTKLLGL